VVLRGLQVEYLALAHFDSEPTLIVAARVGSTRLIDNLPLHTPELGGFSQLARALGGTPRE
jgi:hypothetical protein